MKTRTPVALFDLPELIIRTVQEEFVRAGHQVDTPDDLLEWLRKTSECSSLVTRFSDGSRVNSVHKHRPDVVVIALVPSTTSQSHAHAAALAAGASGAFNIETSPVTLVEALGAASRGLSVLPTEVAASLAITYPVEIEGELTAEELTWIRRLGSGTTIDALAADSSYSPRHFKRILKLLYSKLGAANRTEALIIAARRGILS